MLSSNILFSFKVKQFMSHSIYFHWVRQGDIGCALKYLFFSFLPTAVMSHQLQIKFCFERL